MALKNTIHFGISINQHAELHEAKAGILLERILVKLKQKVAGQGGSSLIQLIHIEAEVAPEFGVAFQKPVLVQTVGATEGRVLQKRIRIWEVCRDASFLDNNAPIRDFRKERLVAPQIGKSGLDFRGFQGLQ